MISKKWLIRSRIVKENLWFRNRFSNISEDVSGRSLPSFFCIVKIVTKWVVPGERNAFEVMDLLFMCTFDVNRFVLGKKHVYNKPMSFQCLCQFLKVLGSENFCLIRSPRVMHKLIELLASDSLRTPTNTSEQSIRPWKKCHCLKVPNY